LSAQFVGHRRPLDPGANSYRSDISTTVDNEVGSVSKVGDMNSRKAPPPRRTGQARSHRNAADPKPPSTEARGLTALHQARLRRRGRCARSTQGRRSAAMMSTVLRTPRKGSSRPDCRHALAETEVVRGGSQADQQGDQPRRSYARTAQHDAEHLDPFRFMLRSVQNARRQRSYGARYRAGTVGAHWRHGLHGSGKGERRELVPYRIS